MTGTRRRDAAMATHASSSMSTCQKTPYSKYDGVEKSKLMCPGLETNRSAAIYPGAIYWARGRWCGALLLGIQSTRPPKCFDRLRRPDLYQGMSSSANPPEYKSGFGKYFTGEDD